MVTFAPVTTACDGSEIVPSTVPLAVACAIAVLGRRNARRSRYSAVCEIFFIIFCTFGSVEKTLGGNGVTAATVLKASVSAAEIGEMPHNFVGTRAADQCGVCNSAAN